MSDQWTELEDAAKPLFAVVSEIDEQHPSDPNCLLPRLVEARDNFAAFLNEWLISAARGKQTRTPGTVEVCSSCMKPWDGTGDLCPGERGYEPWLEPPEKCPLRQESKDAG